MNREVKDLITSIAKELKVKVSDVEKAYEAPFQLMAIIMKHRCDVEKEIYPSMRIPYFLLFHCPHWNKARLRKKQKRKNEAI